MKPVSSSTLILLTTVFLTVFGNLTFFSNVADVYDTNAANLAFIGSLAVVFGAATVLLLSVLCFKYTIKPVLIGVLLLSSLTAYFMDTYNVIIDDSMIQNVMHTDMAESLDLLSLKLVLYLSFLGILPSIAVYKIPIAHRGFRAELFGRSTLFLGSAVLGISIILVFGGFYASFFREHKPLRFYQNPTYYMYSAAKYVKNALKADPLPLQPIALDASIPASDTHRELIIFVVGETARADRFSLNGYSRETNPLLAKDNVISFPHFWSCGTTTAVSVPCMFSMYKSSEYDDRKAEATENILDVLKRAGVNVLWLDNNSDSKGVAVRVAYESYRTPEKNPVCDLECRDEGMLANIQKYIDEHQQGDIFIVLHQLGNHGPAYFKRYPPSFEKFQPVCHTNQLEDCSKEEIENAYDNAILYTDYFLDKTIALLKRNSAKFESAMFYVSDHGESLGEHGVYLHGMPNLISPEAQRWVPAIMWFGPNFDEVDMASLVTNRDAEYSHDNIFHTILGFMEIETSVYDKNLDIIHAAK